MSHFVNYILSLLFRNEGMPQSASLSQQPSTPPHERLENVRSSLFATEQQFALAQQQLVEARQQNDEIPDPESQEGVTSAIQVMRANQTFLIAQQRVQNARHMLATAETNPPIR